LARKQAYTEANIKAGFAATGLAPLDLDTVLSSLQIRPKTPEQAPTLIEHYTPQIPQNISQVDQHSAVIKGHL
jgi:cell division protein FtsX